MAIVSQVSDLRFIADHSTFIMPAPSSLWGRLRGRFDIAYLLAKSLRSSLRSPPLALHWRLKKRAAEKKNPSDKKIFVFRPWDKPSHPSCDVLLIDDVFTTGTTVFRTISALPNSTFHVLVLADSLR